MLISDKFRAVYLYWYKLIIYLQLQAMNGSLLLAIWTRYTMTWYDKHIHQMQIGAYMYTMNFIDVRNIEILEEIILHAHFSITIKGASLLDKFYGLDQWLTV